jgi:cytochrome c oxidase cbb3-type subunit III
MARPPDGVNKQNRCRRSQNVVELSSKVRGGSKVVGGSEVAKLSLLAIAVSSVVISLAAQAPPGVPARNPAQAAAQAESAERGHTIFKQNCVACHGEDATGGRGPDLIRSSLVRHDKNGDLVGPVVTGGRSDKGMPSFPFNDSQIADLVAFLQTQLALFDLHTRTPGAYPNDIPAERLATGSVQAGQAYFNGAGGCSGCHSPTGDLAGVAKKYNPPDLETRFLYPSGKPSTAIVTMPSGQQIEGTVLLNDGFNVAIMGADGWYHSWPASAVKIEVHDPLAAHAALLQKYTDADMHNIFTYLETLK